MAGKAMKSYMGHSQEIKDFLARCEQQIEKFKPFDLPNVMFILHQVEQTISAHYYRDVPAGVTPYFFQEQEKNNNTFCFRFNPYPDDRSNSDVFESFRSYIWEYAPKITINEIPIAWIQ